MPSTMNNVNEHNTCEQIDHKSWIIEIAEPQKQRSQSSKAPN